ncbi:hypothetical protein CR513_29201, partial [Mucuna pruriens]
MNLIEILQINGNGLSRVPTLSLWGTLSFLSCGCQTVQSTQINGGKVEKEPKLSKRNSGSGFRGETPTAPRRSKLANFRGRIWASGEHPVVAVLANTYYTLDYCSRKKGKGLRCCTLLLFLRLIAHLFHSSKKMKCPIEDHY